MRRFTTQLSNLFRLLNFRNRLPQKPRRRLELELLEDRTLLSGTAALTGTAFVDRNNNGVQDTGEIALAGIVVSLAGTTASGTTINTSVTTDGAGDYNFANVDTGNYQLSASSPDYVGGINTPLTMTGQPVEQNIAFRGLKPGDIHLSDFLTTTTPAAVLPVQSAGNGITSVGTRSNNSPPVVSNPIADVTVAKNASSTVLDLASNFTDPDLTNSEVEIDTNMGPIDVTLFDTAAPQTVANFFNYINSGKYDNDIFHRLVSGFVLQAGGFTFQSNPASLTAVDTFPTIQNEFGASNTLGTVAMAKLGSDPNSASSQFFFNLGDNSSNLDNQNGGFTVFGKIANDASQQVVNDLAAVGTQDESTATALPASEQGTAGTGGQPGTGVFSQIPLQNYTGTSFPTDTTAANYDLITGVKVLQRNEFLTYSLVSNSNPGLVTPTFGTGDNNRLTLAYTADQTGSATITVEATDTFGATVTNTFTVNVGLTLSPSTLPATTVNTAYNQTITATGGTGDTLTTTVTNAVAGLSVPSTGTNSLAITGTPTASGTETFTVNATDTQGDTTSTDYSIVVNPAVTLSPATLPGDTINTAYNQTITADGGTGDKSLTVTNIANAIPGLSVPSSGTNSLAITGTPTATGTETFTVNATDTLGATTSTDYSITVNPAIALSSATLPADTVNTAYNQTITATGGTGDKTLKTTVTNAIAGLSVPSSGTNSLAITGTPTVSGTETFTVAATDAAGATTSTDYSITVNAALRLTPSSAPVGFVNQAYDLPLTADGGTGDKTLTVTNIANAIPGLTVPTSGTNTLDISGTPTATGTETFTVTTTDTAGSSISTDFTITVKQQDTPTVSTAIANVSVAKNAANTMLDLASNFTDAGTTNSEIEIDTNMGPIDVTLFDATAPQTVANFYNYINAGLYNNDIFHRLASGFVLQAGGFTFQANPSQLVPVTTFPDVQNEFGASNTLGTVAMAKLGSDPNSASSQFFFNLANNSSNLDNQNGGFTVFGKIADAASQTVVNNLAAAGTLDESTAAALPASEQGKAGTNGQPGTGVFNQIPLQNYTGTNFPTDTTAANYEVITGVKVLQHSDALTYSIVSNSNPGLVAATLGTSDNNRLTLAYTAGQTGSATITVMATNAAGQSVTSTFTVTVT